MKGYRKRKYELEDDLAAAMSDMPPRLKWYTLIWRVLRPFMIALCVLVSVTGIVYTVWKHVDSAFFAPVDPSDDTQIAFSIESGTSLSRVASGLEEAGLIHSSAVFKYYADFLGYGQKIKAGSYTLSKAMSLSRIADRLTTGDGNPIVRNITVIPGWTVTDIASYLTRIDPKFNRETFLALCRTGTDFSAYYYISDILSANPASRLWVLEGYLMPDTYEVYTNATPEEIIRKLVSQTETVFPEEYHDRADMLGMTMDQVLTLASLIEKEAKTADFTKVSSVFHNRLRAGMALGSDASVKYVSGLKKMSLSGSDLAISSPYNTYLFTGLPPGPICSPSRDAIQAALYPDQTFLDENYLYFCSKDPASGELYFSKTYEEHQNAVSIYSPLWQAYDREHSSGD